MPEISPAALPVAELTAAYAAGDLSPVEVVTEALDRIERLDGSLGAFVAVDREMTLAQAAEAEDAYRRGEALPLSGVPVSIKDTFHLRGMPTTLGSLLHRGQQALRDSGAVRRLRASGAVFTGKTNTAEFGQSATTENLVFGPTRNPWDTERTPGGSSGGAAASVAAGLSTVALGSDGGGSIRIPSAFTGLFGFKPTYGLCRDEDGFRGMTDFVCPGPLAWRVADARIMLEVLADQAFGPVEPDRPLRIAFCARPEGRPVDPGVAAAVAGAVDSLRALGHEVAEVDLPLDGWNDGFGPLVLADEHRERGHLLDLAASILTSYERKSLEAARALTPSDVERGGEGVTAFRRRVAAVFDEYDIVVTPATAVPAFPIGKRPDTIGDEPVDRLWGPFPFAVPFNVTGHPAASLPCGFADGLPVGVQIVARHDHDAGLLSLCEALEAELALDRSAVRERWASGAQVEPA